MDHISDALGPVARAALEAAMFENYEYRSELFRSLVNQGRAEGEAQGVVRGKIEGKIEGRIEGKIEGKIEGEVLGLRTAIVEVLRRRQIPIDAPAQNQLAAVTDAPTLMRFLNRAVTASTLDEVLKD
jgi:predicted transposase YdaD